MSSIVSGSSHFGVVPALSCQGESCTMKRQFRSSCTETSTLTLQTRIRTEAVYGVHISSLFVSRAGNASVAFRKWRLVTARASKRWHARNIIINLTREREKERKRMGERENSSNKTLLSFRATKPDARCGGIGSHTEQGTKREGTCGHERLGITAKCIKRKPYTIHRTPESCCRDWSQLTVRRSLPS